MNRNGGPLLVCNDIPLPLSREELTMAPQLQMSLSDLPIGRVASHVQGEKGPGVEVSFLASPLGRTVHSGSSRISHW